MAYKIRGKTDQYNYENVFDKQLSDLDRLFVEEMMKNKLGLHYVTKTIKSGPVFEVEIYPWFHRAGDIPKWEKKDNKKAQNDLNDRNSKKRFVRLVNENFGKNDLWLSLTHDNGHHPKTMKQAKRNITNYLRRVNRRRKKLGLKNAKYIYILEWETGEEETRCHYHVLMEKGIDRDTLENMWGNGVRNETQRLHPNEDGVAGLAAYMADKKRGKGERRWTPSKNLKQPEEHTSHSRIRSNRKVEHMVMDYEKIRCFFEKEKGWSRYRFTEAQVRYNRFNAAYYIHITAREKTKNEKNGKEDSIGGHSDNQCMYHSSRGQPGGNEKADNRAGNHTGRNSHRENTGNPHLYSV